MPTNAISKLDWDTAFFMLPETKKKLLLELAVNLMPSEPPEPGDLEAHEAAMEEYLRGECARLEDIAAQLADRD
jgi:hypothetical protein